MAKKSVAYYDHGMRPSPTATDVSGMWITKEEPYIITKVWLSRREKLTFDDKPTDVIGYSAIGAHEIFDFEPIRKRSLRSERV